MTTRWAGTLVALVALACAGPEARAESQDELLTHALESYQSEDFEQAIRLLGESNRIRPRADANLLQGMAQLKNGDPERARESFVQALALTPSEFVRESAQTFVRQIKEDAWPRSRPYTLSLDLAFGGDSNYFEDGNSFIPAQTPLFDGSLLVGYRFPSQSSFYAEPSYTFSWEEVFGYPDFRLLKHFFQVPLSLSRSAWFLQIDPKLTEELLGGLAFMSRPAVRFRAQYGVGSFMFGVDYELERDIVLDSAYSYLAGNVHTAKVFVRHFIGEFDYTLILLGLVEAIGDQRITGGTLPLANRSIAPGLAMAWYPSPSWRIEASGYYYLRSYTHAVLPGGLSRSDQQFNLRGKIAYRPSSTLALYLAPGLVANASSLGAGSIDDRNYFELTGMAGIQWEPFR